jgi:hypothetical protein
MRSVAAPGISCGKPLTTISGTTFLRRKFSSLVSVHGSASGTLPASIIVVALLGVRSLKRENKKDD